MSYFQRRRSVFRLRPLYRSTTSPTPPTPTPVVTTTRTHRGGGIVRRRHRPSSWRSASTAIANRDASAETISDSSADRRGSPSTAQVGEITSTYVPASASAIAELVAAAARAAIPESTADQESFAGNAPSAVFRSVTLPSMDGHAALLGALGHHPLPSAPNDDALIMEAIAIIESIELEEVC